MCKFTEWARCCCYLFTSWSHRRCCCCCVRLFGVQSFSSAINPIKNWPSTNKVSIPFLVFHTYLFWGSALPSCPEFWLNSMKWNIIPQDIIIHRFFLIGFMAINSNLFTARSHRIASQLLLIIVVLSLSLQLVYDVIKCIV